VIVSGKPGYNPYHILQPHLLSPTGFHIGHHGFDAPLFEGVSAFSPQALKIFQGGAPNRFTTEPSL
jgi:hypothetical protein